MGLFSVFQQRRNATASPAGPSADEPTSVEIARTRARRRLIGATVLVLLGVVGFPLVFETQPRPIPVNVAIDIPRRDAAAPLPMPATRPAAPQAQGRVVAEPLLAASSTAPPAASAALAATPSAVVSPPVSEASAAAREPASRAQPRSDTAKPEARGEARAPAAAASRATTTAAAAAPARESADAARARAILEGRSVPAASASAATASEGRFVVQVGAFADPQAAREARTRVERIGLRTYVQDVEVGGSKRTRVRVGPFSGREEADRVAAKIKAAGITAAVLTL